MNILFLDVDGVLNHDNSKAMCGGLIGISDCNLKVLKQIIDLYDFKVVLSSTWRHSWNTEDNCDRYMKNKFRKFDIKILDITSTKTSDGNRGMQIIEWLKSHNVDKWVVLDDEIFNDFEQYGIIENLVKTKFYNGGGLKEEHIDIVKNIMEGKYNY